MCKRNSKEEKENLLNITLSEGKSRKTRLRAMAINMHLNDCSKGNIAKILCISEETVKKYIEKYNDKGIIGLLEEKPYRPKSELEGYTEEIKNSLQKKPCATINECCKRIEELTGLKRSPTQVASFIKKKGLNT